MSDNEAKPKKKKRIKVIVANYETPLKAKVRGKTIKVKVLYPLEAVI